MTMNGKLGNDVDPDALDQRLNQISTIWTMVRSAHSSTADRRQEAQEALLQRYQRPIYRYLLYVLRQDAHTADELFQEFALRFVRGDFQGADPDRGRFRDYVKRALLNMVINYQKQKGRDRKHGENLELELEQFAAPDDSAAEFLQCWRKELLDRAWAALAASSGANGPLLSLVLRSKVEFPRMTAADMAERLTEHLRPDQPFSEVGMRKVLQRAREKFGELLLDEVRNSLQTSDRPSLEEELKELGFWVFCRKALDAETK
ncbi:MAG: hypothetical protein K2R98_01785 [Gemmataceae bacterium]|nr:hypothetical protein [Gemmataceae bacterium]